MSRTLRDIGWVSRLDGERDQRYSMPQVLNIDGSRDQRFNPFHQPIFGVSEPLTSGRSRFYESMDVPNNPGIYQIMTMHGSGRPSPMYTGMSNDIYRRLQEHGRGGSDNIASLMDQAAYRGINTRFRYAPADSIFEARAQELFLLNQRNFRWNAMNNGGIDPFWYR